MEVAIVFFYIIALAAGIAVFFKRRIEETIALSIFTTIIVLYFCGLFFGTFIIGVWLCVALSILFGIYAVILLIKEWGGGKILPNTRNGYFFSILSVYLVAQ